MSSARAAYSVDQIKLGNIACSGAVLCALCDLLSSGDIQPPKSETCTIEQLRDVLKDISLKAECSIKTLRKSLEVLEDDSSAYSQQLTKALLLESAANYIDIAYRYLLDFKG